MKRYLPVIFGAAISAAALDSALLDKTLERALNANSAFAQTRSERSMQEQGSRSAREEGSRARLGTEKMMISEENKQEIAGTLDSALKALLSENPISELSEDLVREDRERLSGHKSSQALRDTIKEFKKDWQAQYGRGPEKVFRRNIATVLDIQPFDSQTGMEQRRANVEVRGAQGEPSSYLTLVREKRLTERWHIDLPESIDTAALESSLEQAYARVSRGSRPSEREQAELVLARNLIQVLAQPGQGMTGTSTESSARVPAAG